MNIEKNEILVVGDKISTDILGANNAGVHTAQKLTHPTLKK